jgi:hypothetical protein
MVLGAIVMRRSFFQDLSGLCESCGLLSFNVMHGALLQSALTQRAVRTSMKDTPSSTLQPSMA